jgi:endonuclease/exonuclease/phosphatase family metal-dependent hydrolase
VSPNFFRHSIANVLLITWNVQWCRGVDGRVDPARIVRACRELADFDVLCFQEVGRNFPALAGSGGLDIFALLAAELPEFTAVEGVATDMLAATGGRAQFGQMVLTRLPVVQAFRHLLPWPRAAGVPSMQRVALEVVVEAQSGPLRITTTHLEYFSAQHRIAQVERWRELQAEATAHAEDTTRYEGPFAALPRPPSSILTGDFNFSPEDPLHARLQAPIAPAVPAYRDAWPLVHPAAPHPPTHGRYDKEQWPRDPVAVDFIFVTEDLAERVANISIDADTQASDHQPLVLELAD